jgi:hypothetical protein
MHFCRFETGELELASLGPTRTIDRIPGTVDHKVLPITDIGNAELIALSGRTYPRCEVVFRSPPRVAPPSFGYRPRHVVDAGP